MQKVMVTLPSDPGLTVVEGDVRDTARYAHAVRGCDAVVHMAISNDPSFELDPRLSRGINYDCFEPLVGARKNAGAVNRRVINMNVQIVKKLSPR
jgi:hypothetical protein